MAGAIIYEKDAALGQGISQAGSALAGALGQLGAEYKKKQQAAKSAEIIQEGLKDLGPNPTPIQFSGFINKMIKGNVPQEYIKLYTEAFKPQMKATAQQQASTDFLKRMGISEPKPGSTPMLPGAQEPQVMGGGQGTPQGDLGGIPGFGAPPEQGMQEAPVGGLVGIPGIGPPPQQEPAGIPGQQAEQQPQIASPQQIQPAPQGLTDTQLVAMQGSGIPMLKDYADAEIKRQELKIKRDDSLWNYKPTQNFIKTIDEEAKDAEFGNEVADQVERVVLGGKVSPSDLRNFLAGKFGENFPFLFSAEAAELKFLEKLQAKGLKSYFPRPTEREFLFINSAQAQLGKSDAANLAVIGLQRKFNEIPIRMSEFKDEIIKENGGNPPRDLASRVRNKMKSYKDSLIAESATISYTYGSGEDRKMARQYLRGIDSPTVRQATPMTDAVAKEIYEEAGKNSAEARKLAKKQGYLVEDTQ